MSKKLVDLTELTSTASDDLALIVDVSDTTDSPQGSSRKVKIQNLFPAGSAAAVQAAGTNLASATALTITGVSAPSVFVINAGNAGSGIALPVASATPASVIVANTLSIPVYAYPHSTSESVNGMANGVPYVLPPNSHTLFESASATAWYNSGYTPANRQTFYGDTTGAIDQTAGFTALFANNGHYKIPAGGYLSGPLSISNKTLTIEFEEGASILSNTGVDTLWTFTNCNLTIIRPAFNGQGNCQSGLKVSLGSLKLLGGGSFTNIGPTTGSATNIVAGLWLNGTQSIFIERPVFDNTNSTLGGTFGTGPGAARDIYMDSNGNNGCGFAYIVNPVFSGNGDAREIDCFQAQLGTAGGVIVGPRLAYNGNIRRGMKFQSGAWDVVAPSIAPKAGFLTATVSGSVLSIGYDSAYTIGFTATGSETMILANSAGLQNATFGGSYSAGHVLTLTLTSSAIPNSPIALKYTVQAGDTSATCAQAFATLINAIQQNIAPPAYFKVAASAPPVATIYYPTTSTVTFGQTASGSETITLASGSAKGTNSTETATFGGTYAAGDNLSMTFTSTDLTGSPLTLNYTTVSGDTAVTVAQVFVNLINANANLIAAKITAAFSTQIGAKNTNCVDWAAGSPNPRGSLTIHGGRVDAIGFNLCISDSGNAGRVRAIGTRMVGPSTFINRTDPQSGATITNGSTTGFYALANDDGSGMSHCVLTGFTVPFTLQGNKQFVEFCKFIDPVDQALVGSSVQSSNFSMIGNFVYSQTSGNLSNSTGIVRVQNVLNGIYEDNVFVEDGNTSHSNKFINFSNAAATGYATNNKTIGTGTATTPVTVGASAVVNQLANGVITGSFDALGAAAAGDAAHLAASDPHPQYLTPAEANAAYDALGAASSAVSAHTGASDPHPQYDLSVTGENFVTASGQAVTVHPVNLSSSNVTGNLPVSHLNSGTGATAATAHFGDNTWRMPNLDVLGKLVAIGDSLTAFHNVGSGTSPAWQNSQSQRGFINWFNYLVGNPFDYVTHYVGSITPFLGSNAGVAGEQTKDALARFDHDVRPQKPSVIVIEEGDNDIANGQTQATIFANMKKLIDMALSVESCRQVIVLSIPPRGSGGYTSPQEVIRVATNTQIAQYCALYPGVVSFFNLDTLLIDSGTGFFNTAYSLADGVHPNPWGSYLIAQTYLIPWFQSLFGTSRVLRALPDAYNSSNQPWGNVVNNPSFTGTAGTMSGTVTGTVASNWRLSLDIGTVSSAVASIVTGTDWNGNANINYQQAVFTTNGSGGSELMNLKPTASITSVVKGNYYVAEVEVIITGYTGATNPLTSVFLNLTDNTDGANVQAFLSPSSASDTWPQVAPIRLLLRTPPLRASGTTGIIPGLYARLNAALTGTATVQWGEPVIRPIPQPKLKYLESNSVATISSTSNLTVAANNRTYLFNQGTPTAITTTLDVHGWYPGDQITFNDAQGNAATNNQTIQLSSGNINGSSTFVMTQNNQSVTFTWDGLNASITSNVNMPTSSGLFANKPAAPAKAQRYFATDLGTTGIMIVYDGSKWKPESGSGVIYQSAVQSTIVTGSTSESAVVSVALPANLVSANGSLRVSLLGGASGTAGTHTWRMYLGAASGISGTSLLGVGGSATVLSLYHIRDVINRNSQSSQIAPNAFLSSSGTSTSANSTSAINMANATFLNFTLQLGASADSIWFDAIRVEWLEP